METKRNPLETSTKILALCKSFDPWFPNPTKELIQGWAILFDETNLPTNYLMEAVKNIYLYQDLEKVHARKIIETAKRLRREDEARNPNRQEEYEKRIERKLQNKISQLAESKSIN